MTPFLEKINNLTRPEKLLAFTLKELADERGNVTLEWVEIFGLMGTKSKGRIRAMLSHLKQAEIGHGSTNDLVHFQFNGFQYVKTSARSLREYAQYVKTGNDENSIANGYSAQYVKTSDQSPRGSDQSPRGSDQFGDYRGNYTHSHRIKLLINRSILNPKYLSECLSIEAQKTYEILTDDEVLMPHNLAHAAAMITQPGRAMFLTADWLAQIANGEEHTAVGLFARIVDRDDDGRYKWRAKNPPREFYRSDFAQRHGIDAPPEKIKNTRGQNVVPERGYEVPDEFADIVIG